MSESRLFPNVSERTDFRSSNQRRKRRKDFRGEAPLDSNLRNALRFVQSVSESVGRRNPLISGRLSDRKGTASSSRSRASGNFFAEPPRRSAFPQLVPNMTETDSDGTFAEKKSLFGPIPVPDKKKKPSACFRKTFLLPDGAFKFNQGRAPEASDRPPRLNEPGFVPPLGETGRLLFYYGRLARCVLTDSFLFPSGLSPRER